MSLDDGLRQINQQINQYVPCDACILSEMPDKSSMHAKQCFFMVGYHCISYQLCRFVLT